MNPPPATEAAQTPLQEALALHRQGKVDLAMQRYVAILQKNPEDLDALYYVAVLSIQAGQIPEGIKVIRRALDVGPPQARFHNLQGQAHLRQNQDDEALAAFDRAIACEPGFADAYGNKANLLADMGRREEALAAFDRALAIRPNNAEDVCNRASVLADLGRLPEALAGYDRAIAMLPDFAFAYFNRADLLRRTGRLADALSDYDRAIKLHPEMADAHRNRAVTLKELGRLDDAAASIERALKLQPNNAEVLANRGNLAFEQGRLDAAQADYARALEINPALAEANYGRALACLCQGDWEQGFRLYEYREKLKTPVFKPLPYPRWTGEAAPGERLVLLCEQGLGDMIQFARFAAQIARQGVDVTLLAPEQMHGLLSTLEGVTVAGLADAPAVNGHPVRWLPLMTAAQVLRVRPDSVPPAVPYLAAEPSRIESWDAWLGSDGFRISINWGLGAARTWFDRRRDVPLAAFAPLAEIAGVRLVSLQKGPPLDQIARVPFAGKIEQPGADFDAGPAAFLDTAALMASLDLVITCDTSIAHLAGALARPVFTALPTVSDWRWLADRDDTPWYPTMRLFRQGKAGDWGGVFARIASAVAELAKASAQKR